LRKFKKGGAIKGNPRARVQRLGGVNHFSLIYFYFFLVFDIPVLTLIIDDSATEKSNFLRVEHLSYLTR
tara:strand:- start:124 stop:330 length:207 start_codon:yes stop_codon:yes gene_type:complete